MDSICNGCDVYFLMAINEFFIVLAKNSFLIIAIFYFERYEINSSLFLHPDLHSVSSSSHISQQLLPAASCGSSHLGSISISVFVAIFSWVWRIIWDKLLSPSRAPGHLWSSGRQDWRSGLELLPEEDYWKHGVDCNVNTCHPQHSCHTACPTPL